MARLGLWGRRAIAALALAGLAACGGGGGDDQNASGLTDDDGQIVQRAASDIRAAEQREKLRQQAADQNEVDFSYFRYRIDLSDTTPKACFVFSSALDPELDYSPFIEFRPNFRPALSIEGRELCVGGLEFGTSRTAILKSGLPADDGRTLADTEEVPVEFEDRPPYVGFKGAGVILPRIAADGLAIETVNVDKVEIAVTRINDRALYEKEIGQGETAGEGRYSYLYGSENPRDVESPIWSGVMGIENLQNAAVTTVFPLGDVVGELEPGAYFVSVRDAKKLVGRDGPPASAQRWIVMTDLALTGYRGGHGLDLTLRSLQTGQAVAGAEVKLIARNNEVLAEAQTGPDGRVAFAEPILAGSGNLSPKMVMAYGAQAQGGDFAVLDLTRAPVDLASDAVGGRRVDGEIDGFLYTERGIYRPGETVHLNALLRLRTGEAL
ncbi:MAG: MG2 domain-containing protein, partial [Pseudomonadota bacterium]